MGSGLDDYWDRNIRGEKPDPITCVTGKQYEQLEFNFEDSTPDFIKLSDAEFNAKTEQYSKDLWKLRDNVGNAILQAKGIIDLVMGNIGEGGRDHDNHEFALWGASELLQNAMDLLE